MTCDLLIGYVYDLHYFVSKFSVYRMTSVASVMWKESGESTQTSPALVLVSGTLLDQNTGPYPRTCKLCSGLHRCLRSTSLFLQRAGQRPATTVGELRPVPLAPSPAWHIAVLFFAGTSFGSRCRHTSTSGVSAVPAHELSEPLSVRSNTWPASKSDAPCFASRQQHAIMCTNAVARHHVCHVSTGERKARTTSHAGGRRRPPHFETVHALSSLKNSFSPSRSRTHTTSQLQSEYGTQVPSKSCSKTALHNRFAACMPTSNNWPPGLSWCCNSNAASPSDHSAIEATSRNAPRRSRGPPRCSELAD